MRDLNPCFKHFRVQTLVIIFSQEWVTTLLLLYNTVVTVTTHKDMTSPCLVGEFEAGLIKTSAYLRTDCIIPQVLKNKMVTVDGATRSGS